MSEKNKIDLAIEDARHEEITGLLDQLVAAAKKESGREAALAKLFEQKSELFDVLLSKWKEVATMPAPNVTVETNQDKVIKAIEESEKKLSEKDDRIIELLEQLIVIRGADVILTPQRSYGIIDKVVAKIALPKNKYSA